MTIENAKHNIKEHNKEIDKACAVWLLRNLGDDQAIKLLFQLRGSHNDHINTSLLAHNLQSVSQHAISLEFELERKQDMHINHLQSIKASLEGEA